MGERKVLNKYFPPDFDPADLPKGQRGKDNAMKVRMMLPMTVRCQTCGEFMYKGTKFNCKKEDVVGETYLGIQIFRFYMHCRKCSAEITYKTDPQHLDYQMEHGATRNFEQWKEQQSLEESLKAKRDAEDEDKVKRLENKTTDAKREMDMMEVLDDMLHTKGQHAGVSTEDAIRALQEKAAEDARAAGQMSADLTPEDEEAIRRLVDGGLFVRRLDDGADELHDVNAAPPAAAGVSSGKRIAPPARRRAAVKVARVTQGASRGAEGSGRTGAAGGVECEGQRGRSDAAAAAGATAAAEARRDGAGAGARGAAEGAAQGVLGLGYGSSTSSSSGGGKGDGVG